MASTPAARAEGSPNTSRRLVGKVALVTGGSSGIGLATVRRLVAEGCNVMTTARNTARAHSALADLDAERAVFHHADVTDETAVAGLVEATVERFGRIDYLFNNAGVEGAVGPLAAWSADQVDAVLSANVKGPILCMKHAAPRMDPGSMIVNNSSVLATIPVPGAAPYAASKAALLSLTRSTAAELAERGISVLAICPGVVDTPMMDRVSAAMGAPKAALAEFVSPGAGVLPADTVAELLASLFAGDSSFDSGSALLIAADTLQLIAV